MTALIEVADFPANNSGISVGVVAIGYKYLVPLLPIIRTLAVLALVVLADERVF